MTHLATAPPGGWATAADGPVIEASLHDPELFTLVFDRYYDQLHGYVARRLDRDIADDLTAETFYLAFRQRARFDPRSGVVRAWLFGIATNLMRRHRRSELRAWRAIAKLPPPAPAGDDYDERVAAQVTAEASRRDLAAALARVADRDREAFLLVAFGDLTYAEVAHALGIAPGTVSSRIARARRIIREHLDHTDPRST